MDEGVGHLVQILEGDLMETSVAEASVVFIYLLPRGMGEVAAKLERELQPGARVVTYLFSLPGHDPVKEIVVPVGRSSREESSFNKLRLYVMP
mmetsp:Transcript_40563/g.96383  ORF Transcript_40563/g.96383 Transcript_40563/m.96383 type:complete len:93 (+) Transcript_40563:478-756(+)